jgi:hypothetical protein
MFQKFKNKILNYLIDREIIRTNHVKVATNISRARTVGILFSIDNEQYYDQVNRLIENLTNQKKLVNAIAFVPSRNVPNYFIAKMKIDVLTSKNLNFFGVPKNSFIKDFINKNYDILIDLTITDNLPLDYIATVAQARFKVGRYRKRMLKVFDFLLKKSDDMCDSDYLKYLLDYLTKINTATS